MNDFQQRRITLRLSQAQLAQLVGCNQATISRAEKGLPVNPSTLQLLRMQLDKLCAVHKEPGSDAIYPDIGVAEPHPDSATSARTLAEIDTLKRRVAELETELREAHQTINNLSAALAAGLGRSKAYRPPGKRGDKRYAPNEDACGANDGGDPARAG